ncbi:hypothetical protein V6N12_002671 [Hibiscus sabdariffa]|uniref:Uncharacterized protein n=1 Tax=Hibiscus sabdariffa TaxID=183260 RepID=A0ABR2E9N2_9ROSI
MTDPTLGDGTSPGKLPEPGLCGHVHPEKGIAARGTSLVTACSETTAMDATLTHGVDLDGNMDDSVLVDNNRLGDDGRTAAKNQISSNQGIGISDVSLSKVSFRYTVVGRTKTGSVVSEIPELDVLIGDDDVRMSVLRKEGNRVVNGVMDRAMAGNRFDALHVEDGELGNQGTASARVNTTSISMNFQQTSIGLNQDNGRGKVKTLKLDKSELGKEVVVVHGGSGGDQGTSGSPTKDVGQRSGSYGEVRDVQNHGFSEGQVRQVPELASGAVVPVPVSLHPSKNKVVQVTNKIDFGEQAVSLEENIAAYGELALMEQIKERRVTKVKGSARKSSYPQRKATIVRSENQPASKVNVEGWIGELTWDLPDPGELAMRDSIDIAYTQEVLDGEVRWRSNLPFAGDGLSK